jgi:hypothetical protein
MGTLTNQADEDDDLAAATRLGGMFLKYGV